MRFKNRYMLFELVWKDGKFDATISEALAPVCRWIDERPCLRNMHAAMHVPHPAATAWYPPLPPALHAPGLQMRRCCSARFGTACSRTLATMGWDQHSPPSKVCGAGTQQIH